MTYHYILCASLLLLSQAASAERRVEEATITLQGEQRQYFRLYDTEAVHSGPAILLISGSGCADFGSRFPGFFEKYPAPLDAYFLEKPHVKKGDDGRACSDAFINADYLERRVADNLEFLDTQPLLKKRGKHSIAVVGLSEGGAIAPLVASQSDKIGWLATAGSGGMQQSEELLYFADHGVEPYAKPFSRPYFLKEYAAIKQDPGNLQKEFFGHRYRYWSSHLFRDPIAAYSKLNIPMVAAMGENDDSVPLESGKVLQRYFQAHPDKDFQFIVYPKAGHALQTPGNNGALSFIASLAKWFRGEAGAFSGL